MLAACVGFGRGHPVVLLLLGGRYNILGIRFACTLGFRVSSCGFGLVAFAGSYMVWRVFALQVFVLGRFLV